jgi:predicted amidophosphoribosyltransferase
VEALAAVCGTCWSAIAFIVEPALSGHIKGKRVLLIDDVLTSGAMVNACAR